MSAHPTPATPKTPPDPAPAADPAADDTEHHRRILRELLDLGLDHARLLNAAANTQATAPNPDPAPAATQAAFAIAHDRIARAIRRTILLAQRLADPERQAAQSAAARRRIAREVEDAIDRHPNRADKERLEAELTERLDGPDLDEDLPNRPIPELIDELCRDLGLANMPGQRWKRRTPADIAALCARAARPARAPRSRAAPTETPERLFRLIAAPNGS